MSKEMIIGITYNLGKNTSSAHAGVHEMIELTSGGEYIKPMQSQWLVSTSESIDTWQGYMAAAAGSGDSWSISLVHDANNWKPGWIRTWIQQRL